MQNDTYSPARLALRQAILRDMRLYRSAPMTAADLARTSQEPAIRAADAADTLSEWADMLSLGYLEAVPGFGGAYCRISAKGLEQLLPEFMQSPYIWGPGAI